MFVLTRIEDIVRVHPSQFALKRKQACEDALNLKYSYKVLPEVGLALKVFDILSITEPIVHACQDGGYQSTIIFRLVVFRPQESQILLGKILECDQQKGVRVTLEFFDDIYIPSQYLMKDTE